MGDIMGSKPQQMPMPMQQPNLMQQQGPQMSQLAPTQQQVPNQVMNDGHQLIQNQPQQVNPIADAAVAQPPSANMFKMQKGRSKEKFEKILESIIYAKYFYRFEKVLRGYSG